MSNNIVWDFFISVNGSGGYDYDVLSARTMMHHSVQKLSCIKNPTIHLRWSVFVETVNESR